LVPIISIVGPSKSDRTLLAERLIAAMTKRGHKVASAKRDAHCYNLDTPGKASWRHSQAGAETVVVSSSARLTVFKKAKKEWTLDELTGRFFTDADIVIADGYSSENKPKIKVLLSKTENDSQISEEEVFAVVVSDAGEKQANKIPYFGLNEIEELIDSIEARFLKNSSGII
jgi:molybdopterin-guanine dinucleotide biosynthesis protein B